LLGPAGQIKPRCRGCASAAFSSYSGAARRISGRPALTFMNISTSKPLGSYITERELPRTNAARVFELVLPYQVEQSEQATVFRWRWTYTAEQEAIDLKSGAYACRARHVVEKHAFIRQVLRELRQRGDKLYSVEGQRMPIRGKV